MEVTFFGTSAGLPTKERNTQAIALNLEPFSNSIWLFDVGEGTQHQILHHSIKLGKVDHIFYNAYAWRSYFWIAWTTNKPFFSRWKTNH